MSSQSNNNGLIISIIFASVVIAASLVFLGISLSNSGSQEISQETLKMAIDEYSKEQEAQAQQARIDQQKQKEELAKKNLKKRDENDYVRGAEDAPLTIIEYSDFECPYCKRFHVTMKQVMEAYEGKVNWVYRHFPLNFHNPIASQEAEAAECVGSLAGNDKFWEYTDLVYETTKSNKGLAVDQLPVLAGNVGVDVEAFNNCFEAKTFAEEVKKDMAEGSQAGVSGTPGSFIVNNKTGEIVMIPGALPFDRIKGLIDPMLK